jgi:hypothetical protein
MERPLDERFHAASFLGHGSDLGARLLDRQPGAEIDELVQKCVVAGRVCTIGLVDFEESDDGHGMGERRKGCGGTVACIRHRAQ